MKRKVIGFVLITTLLTKERDVYDKVKKIGGVVECHHLLYPEYDIIAKVEADDYDSLGRIVVDKIRTIHGVIDTKTLTDIKF